MTTHRTNIKQRITNTRLFRNLIALTIVSITLSLGTEAGSEMSFIPSVKAMDLNPKSAKSHEKIAALLKSRNHPMVRQAAAEEPVPKISNNTNQMGYPFQDYATYELIRAEWGAFLIGAQADYFASNATQCFENGLNLAQFDVELLIIKLMYGNAQDNILNSTLFLKNVSDLSYICLDALENNYVYWVYKLDSFGRDFTQIMLGWL